jgi:hypothetical protein
MLLLLLNALLLFLWFISNERNSFWESVLVVPCLFGLSVLALTEILGYIQYINSVSMMWSWGLLDVLLVLGIMFRSGRWLNRIEGWKVRLMRIFGDLTVWERVGIAGLFGVIVLIFLSGCCYPPNNWDSMTYHMARIVHWVGNNSLEYFPTHIYRQLYQPPLMEYLVMHITVLMGDDSLAFIVQWGFYICSGLALVAILRLLGFQRPSVFVGLLLFMLLPAAILQASSTQNDLMALFFYLVALYFGIKLLKSPHVSKYFVYWGLAMGLCLQTKATGYIYLLPLILLIVIPILLNSWKLKTIKNTLLRLVCGAGLVIVLNGMTYIRNFQFNGSLMGSDSAERAVYFNQNWSFDVFFGNVLKNIGLHIGPYPLNKWYAQMLNLFEGVLCINEKGVNYLDIAFKGAPIAPIHEDTAYNTIQWVLIFLVFVWFILMRWKGKALNGDARWILILLLSSFATFVLLLKWQPWHGRLHFPFFAAGILLVSLVSKESPLFQKATSKLLPWIFVVAFVVVVGNYTRPIFAFPGVHKTVITNDRYKKYFSNRPQLVSEYQLVEQKIVACRNKTIGVELKTEDDWEYPLFRSTFDQRIRVQHLFVNNATKGIPQEMILPGYIVSTKRNQKLIQYGGVDYVNITPNAKEIWLYQ